MIDAALILAGGRGSRLEPWPAPKCLLPVNGRSILERLLAHLAEQDICRVIVCTGYRAGDVEAAVRGRSCVFFSNAGVDAEMGQRLLFACENYGLVDDRVLVVYGDEVADVDIHALERHHDVSRARLTFTACRQVLPFGVVRGSHVYDGESVLANIGFVIADAPAGSIRPEDGVSDWINRLDAVGRASCYLHEGKRATVNSFAELRRAEEVWG